MTCKIYEIRTDCESFEMKRWDSDTEDCQTDGHYLCSGCRRIAPFDLMELSDNRVQYYRMEEEAQIKEDELVKLV